MSDSQDPYRAPTEVLGRKSSGYGRLLLFGGILILFATVVFGTLVWYRIENDPQSSPPTEPSPDLETHVKGEWRYGWTPQEDAEPPREE